MVKKKELLLIGRREAIDLPDLKLIDLDAKIDTGAYTASMHCHHIKLVRERHRTVLKFKLLDPEHPSYQKRVFVFKNFKTRKVKSSNGEIEQRYSIEVKLKIYSKVFKVEFTLTDRSDMKYPILLGRKFIKQGFVVDVTKSNLAKKNRKYVVKILKEKK